jgi:hypothetical protein
MPDERLYTNQDPARPGGKGSALAVILAGASFALILAVFLFYSLRGC